MPIQQGMNQQTPAVQSMIRSAVGSVRRAVKRTAKRAAKRVVRSAGRKVKSKLKFGSPAWQKKYRVGKFAKKKR